MASLAYVVLYTPDLERLKSFYGALGLSFVAEQHGTGPAHYSSTLLDGVVFEIYPGDAPQKQALGINVPSIQGALIDLAKAHFEQQPNIFRSNAETRSTILRDPDGRRVEIFEAH